MITHHYDGPVTGVAVGSAILSWVDKLPTTLSVVASILSITLLCYQWYNIYRNRDK